MLHAVNIHAGHGGAGQRIDQHAAQSIAQRMAKAALKVRGVLDCTTMRLPNVGPGEPEFERAREGMRAAGLL